MTKAGQDYEKHLAKRYNAQTTPASGAFIYRKLDVDNVGEARILRISAKEHTGATNSFSTKYEWLDQASDQIRPGEIPVLFYKNLKSNRESVVFDEDQFHRLLGTYELLIENMSDVIKNFENKLKTSKKILSEYEELENYKKENAELRNKITKLEKRIRDMKNSQKRIRTDKS